MAIGYSSNSSPYLINRYPKAKEPYFGLKGLLRDLRACSVAQPQFSWPSDLPEQLLELILDHLPDLSDLIRCRGVCRSWRSAIARMLCGNNHAVPPLLLLFSFETLLLSRGYWNRVLCSPTESIKELDLPRIFHRGLGSTPCISSYRGWLLVLQLRTRSTVYKKIDTYSTDRKTTSTQITFSQFSSLDIDPDETTPLYLFNPYSRMLVKLREPPPPLCMNGQLRFVTSCTASDPNCIICAYNLCSNSVAFYVLRHKKWSPLFSFNSDYTPVEAIFYQGHFYAVDDHGVLRRLLFDIEDNSYKEEVVSVDIGGSTPHRYLVESPSSSSSGGGALMMVVRRFDLETRKTNSFEIFKLDWRNGKWEEVNSLGDQALFLSHQDSKLVSVWFHYPRYRHNCIYFKKNTIFFVDDLFAHWNSDGKDFGLYDLGNRKVRPLYLSHQLMNLPHSGWFQPAL